MLRLRHLIACLVLLSAAPHAQAAGVDLNGVELGTAGFLRQLNSGDGPPLETMTPADARKVLEGAQSNVTTAKADAEVSEKRIEAGGLSILLYIVRPAGVEGTLPGFMFFHGGGWVLGDFATHERFVRDLVADSGAVAIFVEYTRSPEAKYPVALNECYAATQWVAEHGAEIQVDGERLAIVGNSVGGNLTAAVALKAKAEGGPELRLQVLFWPVTDANFETASYRQFQQGYFLTRPMMIWMWDNYTRDPEQRAEITASPLRATKEQLAGLPPALVQTAECEAYARKLNEAGVPVVASRKLGMIHDYGLLNPLAEIPAVKDALHEASEALKKHLQ
jgi:acetyl esterase